MLPDTLLGGVTLTFISMTVVFLVLGFLAQVIEVFHRLAGEGAEAPPRRQVLIVSSRPELEEGEMSLPDIDPAKKAAILAAISVCLGRPETAMFLRKNRDEGPWMRPFGIARHGRSGYRGVLQAAKEKQSFGDAR